MENPLSPKHEEVLKGGQMAIVIGFVATFLLGVIFVFLMGNLLSQVSDGVRQINVELSGSKQVVVDSTALACLNATVRTEQAAIFNATDKTAEVMMEEVLNAYDTDKLTTLSTTVYNCTMQSLPSYVDYGVSSVNVPKTGDGLSVETATRAILNL